MEKQEKQFAGYLFVYFTGESENGEQVYFAVSKDGLHWKDLNGGYPVLSSSLGEKGVRDPFLLRSAEGDKFFLIATDLRIANGKGWGPAQYEGSRSILVWESEDLMHWSEERRVEVGIPQAGCVWAPEAIYDSQRQNYLVFWASMVKEEGEAAAKQRIYCSQTKDFRSFTKAVKYIERENHIIDTTIIGEQGCYYRISKDETTKSIRMDKGCDLLNGPFVPVPAPELERLDGVEGPAAFRLNEAGGWCLMVDRFASDGGYMPLFTDHIAEGDFRVLAPEEYDMGENKKRHGSVLPLFQSEYDALTDRFLKSNPIIKGLYADPDIAKFGDTYYIYPTTDGYSGWSGTRFHVFSSADRKEWKDEGVILDVASQEVAWSVGSAWAPAIARKNGSYYFYFCAKRKDGVSCIGAAVSKSPAGPYRALPEPLLTIEMVNRQNLQMWQTIDPSVFIEDDGTAYLLFGNGTPAVVRLKEDMVSIAEETMSKLEGAYDFREAVTVIKRNGVYHFTWSCDDTGNENYHVNYGTADNIYGPIDFKYTVLEKEPEKNILGTGHHSILKDENEEYYIAYHRFGTPLEKYPDEKGCHREVCLDRLEFTEEGLIKPVRVTG